MNRRITYIPALAATCCLLAACGGNTSGSVKPKENIKAQSKVTAIAKKVPKQFSSDGVLLIGTNATDAPNEFIDSDGKTIIGVSVDLGEAIAQQFGLKAKFVNAPFDAIIPGLQSGKYELGMAAFSDTKEREKVVDFVTYYETGTLWAVKAGNPKKITPDNACGSTAAAQVGNAQLDDAQARSKACSSSGKKPIDVKSFQSQNDAITSVVSGRADAWLSDAPVVAYAVKQSKGALELATDKPYDRVPLGIAVPKDKGEFTEAVREAVQTLFENGTYTKIMKKWGIEAGAIDKPIVNGATG